MAACQSKMGWLVHSHGRSKFFPFFGVFNEVETGQVY